MELHNIILYVCLCLVVSRPIILPSCPSMALPRHRSRASCGYLVVWRMCFDAMPGLQVLQDKNPGSEAKCKEALIKLQQGREQAGTQMDSPKPWFRFSNLDCVTIGGALRNDFSIFQSEAQGKHHSLCRIDICFTQRICSRLLGYPLGPRCFF